MNENIRPTVDPWELLVDHNQRIQLLEKKIELLEHNQQEFIRAITHSQELHDINRRTIDKILDSQRSQAALTFDILNRSTPSGTGNH